MKTTTKAKAAPSSDQINVRSVTPCLTFSSGGEEAVNFYVSVFANSRITSLQRMELDGPIPKGSLLHAAFELNGQPYTAFDGGPSFEFSQATSLVATCDTQEELDEIWARLCSDGGEPGPCGWLTDRFGVSWQVVPHVLGEMMSNAKDGNPGKVMEALMQMGKLDIAALQKAYKSR